MPDAIDDIEIRKKRALYRANHRGTKEMDILIGKYAKTELMGMSEGDLEQFEKFLSVPDRELEGWIIRDEYSQDGEYRLLVNQLRKYHGLI